MNQPTAADMQAAQEIQEHWISTHEIKAALERGVDPQKSIAWTIAHTHQAERRAMELVLITASTLCSHSRDDKDSNVSELLQDIVSLSNALAAYRTEAK